jgi:uncharacterized protein (DUF362 family)
LRRRNFLKVMGAATFGFLARRAFPLDLGGACDVAVVRSPNLEAAAARAVELLGGIRRFVKPGDVVVVKPNIGFSSPPEVKATTDPVLVRTLVHLCFQALAAKVYVFDRPVSNARLSYVTSGIKQAAEEAGARVFFVEDQKLYRSVPVRGGVYLQETTVNRYVLESDVLINAPVAKQHSTSELTLGMKNLMGVTGDNRSRWHWPIHDALSDFSLAVRSHLTVIDCSYIMTRGGPTGGNPAYLKKTDRVIASANVAQADAEAALLFGRAPEQIGYLRLAQQKGIGAIRGYSRQEITL